MRIFKTQSALGIVLAAVFVVGASTASWAQTVPVEAEGPIGSVTDNGDGSGSLSVMGVDVNLPAGLLVDTPTAQLTISEFADPTPLPGRSEPGFIGGTGIVIGNSVDGVVSATSVFSEPAENVLAGVVTANNPVDGGCSIAVQGVEVVFLEDPRMPFSGAFNEAGFEIDPCTVPVGGAASVEGYLGEDGRLYAFILESDDATVADAGDQVSVTRAQCRVSKGELEVRGSSTQTSGQVTVFDNQINVRFGTANIAADGTYRFRGNVATCPNEVRVEDANGNFAVAAVTLD